MQAINSFTTRSWSRLDVNCSAVLVFALKSVARGVSDASFFDLSICLQSLAVAYIFCITYVLIRFSFDSLAAPELEQ